MTVRDAILRAVPVFVAHRGGDLYAIRDGLERAGIPAALAAEVIEFLPLAVARALLQGMGIRFADEYIRGTAQGQEIGRKPLMEEPVYREGLAMADEIVRMGQDTFMAVAGWSSEYQAVNKAMNAGSRPEDMSFNPPLMRANSEDARRFDDTSGGVQPRKPAWWKFWK